MLAIDTNLVVRYLTADYPQQSPKAKALIDSEDVSVCTTVLLESDWVVRSVYGFARKSSSAQSARIPLDLRMATLSGENRNLTNVRPASASTALLETPAS